MFFYWAVVLSGVPINIRTIQVILYKLFKLYPPEIKPFLAVSASVNYILEVSEWFPSRYGFPQSPFYFGIIRYAVSDETFHNPERLFRFQRINADTIPSAIHFSVNFLIIPFKIPTLVRTV